MLIGKTYDFGNNPPDDDPDQDQAPDHNVSSMMETRPRLGMTACSESNRGGESQQRQGSDPDPDPDPVPDQDPNSTPDLVGSSSRSILDPSPDLDPDLDKTLTPKSQPYGLNNWRKEI